MTWSAGVWSRMTPRGHPVLRLHLRLLRLARPKRLSWLAGRSACLPGRRDVWLPPVC
jgi:hypothetical protein